MWRLDPAVTFLNHGSFGACPEPVLEAQARLRAEMEREPVLFLSRERLESRLDAARAALAAFVGADPKDLAFLANATTGVNTVLRSLPFGPGDELLTTDHLYNACRNALEVVAHAVSARVVVAAVPFPLNSDAQVMAAVLGALTPHTRLALLDHVTSPTGLVLPLAGLVRELAARGVDTLVDGAHAPGMVALDLRALGAAYYVGNCHKWLCAPKGAGFIHVRRDRQASIRPLVISHGANSSRTDRSRYCLEFDWTGTHDPTPYLAVPTALSVMEAQLPGGWPALMGRNRAVVLEARRLLCARLGVAPPCPDAMIGALAAVRLPDATAPPPPARDPVQVALFERFGIEVPVIPWPASPRRWLRISAQIYNRPDDYERLATALPAVLG